jgi:hypothetical protein
LGLGFGDLIISGIPGIQENDSMLCAQLLCGIAKEDVIHILDEMARGQSKRLEVLLESLSKEMRAIPESLQQDGCCEVTVSGSDQVKAKRGWETGWSRIVKKASFRSNIVKNCVWGGIVERRV